MSFDDPRGLAIRFVVGVALAVVFLAVVGAIYGVQRLLGY